MEMYTVKEAAERLKVGEGTILLWIKSNRLRHAKKNGQWRIPECCLDGHTQGEEGEADKPEKQVSRSAEFDRLTQKREELKVAIEVRTLEGEVSGILTGEDKAKVLQMKVDVAKREENVAGREEAVAELDSDLDALEDRERAVGTREEATTTHEAELGEREEEVKKGESHIKVSDDLRRRADAAANKLQKEKWDIIRFLWGARKTLERTIKGASKPITTKEAITLMWQELHFYDEIYGSYAVNEKGELLVDGEPIKSWQQEEGFYNDKNTSTIKVSW